MLLTLFLSGDPSCQVYPLRVEVFEKLPVSSRLRNVIACCQECFKQCICTYTLHVTREVYQFLCRKMWAYSQFLAPRLSASLARHQQHGKASSQSIQDLLLTSDHALLPSPLPPPKHHHTPNYRHILAPATLIRHRASPVR